MSRVGESTAACYSSLPNIPIQRGKPTISPTTWRGGTSRFEKFYFVTRNYDSDSQLQTRFPIQALIYRCTLEPEERGGNTCVAEKTEINHCDISDSRLYSKFLSNRNRARPRSAYGFDFEFFTMVFLSAPEQKNQLLVNRHARQD